MTRKYLWFAVPLVAVLGVGFWQFMRGSAPGAAPSAPLVPVIATKVETKNVSDYLAGLGTVQPFNRVTIHARVDGELQEVAFTEGQLVRAGDLLAKIDPRPFQASLDQAKAKKAEDQAQLVSAEKDLARAKMLVDRFAQTQQALDQAQAKVDQLTAAKDADTAAIEAAQTQLGYTTIASPLDGRTGIRLIDKGNIVHASDPGGLVIITQVQPIAVIFSLPQDYLQSISAAMKQRKLKVTAYSRDDSTKLGEGALLLIDNQIDAATGTLRLKASFPNEDDSLWPGQFVNARLELAERNDAVAVPAQVIQRGPNELYAYVINQNMTADRRRIKVGPIRDGLAVIEDGLSPGELVVVDGQFKLRPGARVAVTMMPNSENGAGAAKTADRSSEVVR